MNRRDYAARRSLLRAMEREERLARMVPDCIYLDRPGAHGSNAKPIGTERAIAGDHPLSGLTPRQYDAVRARPLANGRDPVLDAVSNAAHHRFRRRHGLTPDQKIAIRRALARAN